MLKEKVDEVAFKEGINAEKKGYRDAKRKEDEVAFKEVRTAEKKGYRDAKRKEDELAVKAGETASKKKQREGKLDTPLKRQYAFNDAVREGHGKFHCVCCKRIRNRRSIVEYTEDLAQTITNIHPTIIERTIGILDDSDRVDGKHYICKVCRDKVKNNKIPAVCHKNNLELSEHHTEMT